MSASRVLLRDDSETASLLQSGNITAERDGDYEVAEAIFECLLLRQFLKLGLAVVDFAKNPVLPGSLARSTTPKSKLDGAAGVKHASADARSNGVLLAGDYRELLA